MIASGDIGRVLLIDIDGTTVCRAEIRTAIAICNTAIAFYKALAAATAPRPMDLWRPPRDWRPEFSDDFSVTVHAIESDATNSAVWKGQKLLSCIIITVTMLAMPTFADDATVDQDLEVLAGACKMIRRIADCLVVLSGTAAALLGMLKKQFASLGCPTWMETRDAYAAGRIKPDHFTSYFYAADRGPDQTGIKPTLYAAVSKTRNLTNVHSNCLNHGNQRTVRGGLVLTDTLLKVHGRGWKYYSSVCKYLHAWRDLSRSMFIVWNREHLAKSAMRYALKVPPKPNAAVSWTKSCGSGVRRGAALTIV